MKHGPIFVDISKEDLELSLYFFYLANICWNILLLVANWDLNVVITIFVYIRWWEYGEREGKQAMLLDHSHEATFKVVMMSSLFLVVSFSIGSCNFLVSRFYFLFSLIVL
jgi:hypothetical protein